LRPLRALPTEADIRLFEHAEAARLGLELDDLMARAGAALFRFIRVHWPSASRIVIVCGDGNNGGDGFVLARLLRSAGQVPRVIALSSASNSAEAIRARAAWVASGGSVMLAADTESLGDADLVVDAVFGIGLRRSPEGHAATAITHINQSNAPVLAVDLPSGLEADSGIAPGPVVRATRTLSFIAGKAGVFTGTGRRAAGIVSCDDLDLAQPITSTTLLGDDDLVSLRSPRPNDAHKGDFGRALIVAGSPGMAGAALLATGGARAAAPGYVQLIAPHDAVLASLVRHPEVMADHDESRLVSWLPSATAVLIGPGIGTDSVAAARLAEVFAVFDQQRSRLVLDADALNLLAASPRRFDPRLVMTPHPAEAARLLGVDTATVQHDRIGSARTLCDRYGGIVILKGAGTLVAHPDGRLAICADGNPGMAVAGMGDVLAGLLVGLLAQDTDAWRVATQATLLHARAGDRVAARLGERAVTPSAVIEALTGLDP